MKTIVASLAALALVGCSQGSDSNADADVAEANAADANAAADSNAADSNMSGTALASLNETTWEFTDPESGKQLRESIDANGNYITVSGSEHIDHGKAVMKDGKACFTSAMNDEGENCWTDPMLAVGESGETTSDKGEKVTVKRVAYVPLTM